MNRYEQITYKGHHINIYYDDCPESPREWSNLGTFYTAHRRYRPEKEFDEHFDFDEVCDGRPGNIRKSFLQKHVALNLFLIVVSAFHPAPSRADGTADGSGLWRSVLNR